MASGKLFRYNTTVVTIAQGTVDKVESSSWRVTEVPYSSNDYEYIALYHGPRGALTTSAIVPKWYFRLVGHFFSSTYWDAGTLGLADISASIVRFSTKTTTIDYGYTLFGIK